VQRAEHGRGGVEAGEHVHQRHTDLVGRPLLRTRDRHETRLRLGHEVVARASRGRALRAEPGDRAVDDPGIALPHLVVAHAEPVGTADLEVLDHDVGAGAQLEGKRPAVGLREVECAASLASVDGEVIGRLPAGKGRAPRAGFVAALGTLDLDDVRAQVGENHRAVGTGEHARQVGDPDTRERGAWR
jgi:hypothetical protein